jgi:hypothetical protein
VDQVRERGGTVCLGIGAFTLREPVRITEALSVRIRGHGTATLLNAPRGAFIVDGAAAIAIEDMGIALWRAGETAIAVRSVAGLSLQRLTMQTFESENVRGAAISLAGTVTGTLIRDNTITAATGIVAASAESDDDDLSLTTVGLVVESNTLTCTRKAIAFTGAVTHLMGTRIEGNEVSACRNVAIDMLGSCGPGASIRIANNELRIVGSGISAGVDGLWIEGNKLSTFSDRGQRANGAGIQLRTGFDPNGIDRCQILSNQISEFDGAGIAIEAPVGDLIVKLNQIEQCGNGIVATNDASSISVAIENNQVTDVGGDGTEEAPFTAGILVARAIVASVVGNVLLRIGRRDIRGRLRVGIGSVGVQRLIVSGNHVAEIGPWEEFVNEGAGIFVVAPFEHSQVMHNHVARDLEFKTDDSGESPWFALFIGEPLEDRPITRFGDRRVVRVDDARTLVLGAGRPVLVTRSARAATLGGGASSVLGNLLQARGSRPAADVTVRGDCIFNDNRCDLLFGGRTVVRLAAKTTIVNANRVAGGEISIELSRTNITALGNITSRAILAGGTPLGAPWNALNVTA